MKNNNSEQQSSTEKVEFPKERSNKVKSWWYKATRWARVKVEDNHFVEQLLNHKDTYSPQGAQGMWQAYGSIRAARITARGAVFATGIIGGGLWLYQQTLSEQKREVKLAKKKVHEAEKKLEHSKKELDEKYDALKQQQVHVNKALLDAKEAALAVKIMSSQLESADAKIKNLCGRSETCYSDYRNGLATIEQTVARHGLFSNTNKRMIVVTEVQNNIAESANTESLKI